jgi:hypothetical protein
VAADFYDLDGEGLEPAEQSMQSCLIMARSPGSASPFRAAPLVAGEFMSPG